MGMHTSHCDALRMEGGWTRGRRVGSPTKDGIRYGKAGEAWPEGGRRGHCPMPGLGWGQSQTAAEPVGNPTLHLWQGSGALSPSAPSHKPPLRRVPLWVQSLYSPGARSRGGLLSRLGSKAKMVGRRKSCPRKILTHRHTTNGLRKPASAPPPPSPARRSAPAFPSSTPTLAIALLTIECTRTAQAVSDRGRCCTA